jgi:hypothetical protein
MQNAHRVWPHDDGRFDFPQLGSLLEDFWLETELPERPRSGQAATPPPIIAIRPGLLAFSSLLVQLPSGIQIIEIQNRVEDQKVTARSLPAPKRIS